MVYGHYISDAAGNQHFFVEGCSNCRMSTGGSHESTCPMKDIRVPDKPRYERSYAEFVRDSMARIDAHPGLGASYL